MDHKEFFNSMAENWDNICQHDEKKINEILDLISIKQGSRVIDVGTGTGVMLPFLSSRIGSTGEIVAVDAAEKMINIAKSKYADSEIKFIVGDIFTLELPLEQFDLIMCYSVFPHFEYKTTAPERLGKFLKQGGKIAICHSQSRDQINAHHKKCSTEVSRDYLPEAETIKDYFHASGFKTIVEIDDDRMFVVVGEK